MAGISNIDIEKFTKNETNEDIKKKTSKEFFHQAH